MKLEQAARQALEALIEANVVSERYQNAEKREQAITALREALAEQAEQEPVGWYSHKGGFNECGEGQPLYAAPVRTKDLTDDEIWKVWDKVADDLGFARAVIAADREKNR